MSRRQRIPASLSFRALRHYVFRHARFDSCTDVGPAETFGQRHKLNCAPGARLDLRFRVI